MNRQNQKFIKKTIVPIRFKRNEAGQVYGFIFKSRGEWRRCDENSARDKRIVLVDDSIKADVMEGALYRARIVPMHTGNGFVAIWVKPVRYDAKISAIYHDDGGHVEIEFGKKKKKIIFNPMSHDPRFSSLDNVIELLRDRPGIHGDRANEN